MSSVMCVVDAIKSHAKALVKRTVSNAGYAKW